MVDAKLVAALVMGALLAVTGAIGGVVLLAGTVLGATEWGLLGWLLVLAFVGGSGILTYALVVLAGDVADLAGDGLGGLAEGSGVGNLDELLE